MLDEERQQKVLQAIYLHCRRRGQDMLQNLLSFGHVLKFSGLDVTLSGILEAFKSLQYIDLAQREYFYTALEASFVRSRDERELFSFAFEQFWMAAEPGKSEEEIHIRDKMVFTPDGIPGEEQKEDYQPGYSADPLWQEKDFDHLDEDEIEAMIALVEKMVSRLSLRKTRRFRSGNKGKLDWRRTMSSSLRSGGELLVLKRKKRRKKKAKLVVLCDVSGSMENYSRFLLEFVFALQKAVSQVESFVFSTSIAKITYLLKQVGVKKALQQLRDFSFDWAGGTNIGKSVEEFNNIYAPGIFTGRTIVVIICDGWDRGDVTVLSKQMAALHRRAWKVVWLNPLAGSTDYEPTCKGMIAALPYVDIFLPFHNFKTLKHFGAILPQHLHR